jgi:hypothetical protein
MVWKVGTQAAAVAVGTSDVVVELPMADTTGGATDIEADLGLLLVGTPSMVYDPDTADTVVRSSSSSSFSCLLINLFLTRVGCEHRVARRVSGCCVCGLGGSALRVVAAR